MKKQISEHAAAAKMIRAELKRQGIAATVRASSASMTSSVDVTLTADPMPATVKAVTAFVDGFQYGHFDGMQDLYEYSNRRDDLPQVKYTFVRVDYSDELRQAAWDYCRARYGLEDAPASQRDAHGYLVKGWDVWGSCLLHRVLNGSEGAFWRDRKPRTRATAGTGRGAPTLRVVK